MQSPKRWLVLAIVSVALLLIVVDMTVLYTALPKLTHALHASASDKLWIVNAYALTVSGLLLGMGTLGDRLGHKNLFLSGMVVFALASVAAAFSPTAHTLIAARAGLGIGAAMMMPATLSIIRLTFTDSAERAVAIGIWASVASGGAALGPVVGGALLEHFWWGSVFLVNVPIVLLALPLAWYFIAPSDMRSGTPWDVGGSVLTMIGLVGVTYAIKEAGKLDPSWNAALLSLAIGTAALVAFVRQQRGRAQPMIDFGLFREPIFSSAVLAAVIASAALVGMQLVFSQRLQLVLGMSPWHAGLATLPLPIAAFFAGPVAGRLLGRMRDGHVMAVSMLLSALGMGGYILAHDAALGWQIATLALLGLGIGGSVTAASSTIMHRAPPERAGMAASIEEVSYELGGVVGVTLMGSLLSAVYAGSLLLPAGLEVSPLAYDSLDEALLIAESLPAEPASLLGTLARKAFDSAFVAVLGTASSLLLVTAAWIWVSDKRAQARH